MIDFRKTILENSTINEIINRSSFTILDENAITNEIHEALSSIPLLDNGYSRAVFYDGEYVYKVALNKEYFECQLTEATIIYHLRQHNINIVPNLYYVSPILLIEEYLPENFSDWVDTKNLDLDGKSIYNKYSGICSSLGIELNDCLSEFQYRVKDDKVYLCDLGDCYLDDFFSGIVINENNYIDINHILQTKDTLDDLL